AGCWAFGATAATGGAGGARSDDAPGTAGSVEGSCGEPGTAAAGAATSLPAAGTLTRRLALPDFVTMASSFPFASAGTETVAVSSDITACPSLPVAFSTSWWSPAGSGWSSTSAKSPLWPAVTVATTFSPLVTSTVAPGSARPAMTVDPSGSTRRTSNAGVTGGAASGACGSALATACSEVLAGGADVASVAGSRAGSSACAVSVEFSACLAVSPALFAVCVIGSCSSDIRGSTKKTINAVAATRTDKASQPARFLMFILLRTDTAVCTLELPLSYWLHKLFSLFGLAAKGICSHFYEQSCS